MDFLSMRTGLKWVRQTQRVAGNGGERCRCAADRVGDTNTYVDSFVGEARGHGGALFFGVTEEDGEFLDGGHGDVSAVVSG